jgi:hypothetical protein
MMEELINDIRSSSTGANAEQQTRECSSQIPLRYQEEIRKSRAVDGERNVRFPWTHKREAVDFQSLKVLLSRNQVAVPWC